MDSGGAQCVELSDLGDGRGDRIAGCREQGVAQLRRRNKTSWFWFPHPQPRSQGSESDLESTLCGLSFEVASRSGL
jgi:hypothetical protein